MPRPQKLRTVCQLPRECHFGPYGQRGRKFDAVTLAVDEYETIRLIDHEEYDQEETAKLMQVARTTVQRIYIEARKKVADALVNGKQIFIEGGNYVLNEQNHELCDHSRRRRMMRGLQNTDKEEIK